MKREGLDKSSFFILKTEVSQMPDASVDRKAVSGDDCSVEERGCRNNSSQGPAGDAPGWR